MKKEIEAGGYVGDDGSFKMFDRDTFLMDFRSMFDPGDRFTMSVTLTKGVASVRLQGYYFAAVVKTATEFMREQGYEDASYQARLYLEGTSPELVEVAKFTGEVVRVSLSEALRRKEIMVPHVNWCIKEIAEVMGKQVLSPQEYYAKMHGIKPEFELS